MVALGWVLVAISWFLEFPYFSAVHVSGMVVECSGFDPVAIACGIGAGAIAIGKKRVALFVAGITALAIGFNAFDVLCPEYISSDSGFFSPPPGWHHGIRPNL